MHPHQNAEIITLPLTGALKHADALGNQGVIQAGVLQIISAGPGLAHSEYSNSPAQPVRLLQIWLTTDQPNAAPHYDQQAYTSGQHPNTFQQVASPFAGQAGVQVRQQAWLHVGTLTPGVTTPSSGLVINCRSLC